MLCAGLPVKQGGYGTSSTASMENRRVMRFRPCASHAPRPGPGLARRRRVGPCMTSPSQHDRDQKEVHSMTTFDTGQKTHSGVLPRPRTLEPASADIPGSRNETGRRGAGDRAPGVGHGRGEISKAQSEVDGVELGIGPGSKHTGIPSPPTSRRLRLHDAGRRRVLTSSLRRRSGLRRIAAPAQGPIPLRAEVPSIRGEFR